MEKNEPCLKISFKRGIDGISLPIIKTEKNGYSVYFLLDTGANKNYIRQDFINLSELNADTVTTDDVEEFYGIDNVCHQAQICNFRFNLGEYEYLERFQIIPDGSALSFPTTDGASFHIAGILGTPFMMKHKAQIDFAANDILIALPKPIETLEMEHVSFVAENQI